MITIHIALLISIIIVSFIVGAAITFVVLSRERGADKTEFLQNRSYPFHRQQGPGMSGPQPLQRSKFRGFGGLDRSNEPTDRLAGDSSTDAPPAF